MNANVLMLMSRYDRLNRNLNHIWIHRSTRSHRTANSKYFTDFDRNTEEENHAKSPAFDEPVHEEDNTPSSNDNNVNKNLELNDFGPRDTNSVDSELWSLLKMRHSSSDQRNPETDNSLKRPERSLVSLINNNFTLPVEREKNHTDYEETEEDPIIPEPSESRSGRSRRDNEGRGKQNRRKKNKRRPKRSRRRLGIICSILVTRMSMNFHFLTRFKLLVHV